MSETPIVVIGTGLAGYSLVKEVRKLDKSTPILMITQDDGHSYSKPMLSTGYTKGKSADDLSMADPGKMAEQLGISIRTSTSVTAINPSDKTLEIGSESLSYDKLVLATGAIVNWANIPGSESEKVLSINDLMDYRKFRELADDIEHVMIMGGGLIGCEFANDLILGGKRATIVDPMQTLLSGLVPDFAGKALAAELEKAGVNLCLEKLVTGFEEQDGQIAATLDDGNTLKADLVVSAIGLRPNIKLAEAAGIECGRGIKTNRLLETSEADIFALGDVAEVDGHVLLYVLPLMSGARALAKTLCGEPTEVSYATMPVATKTPACPVVTAVPRSQEGEWEVESDGTNVKAVFKSDEEEALGFVLTGDKVKEKLALTKLVKGIHQ